MFFKRFVIMVKFELVVISLGWREEGEVGFRFWFWNGCFFFMFLVVSW